MKRLIAILILAPLLLGLLTSPALAAPGLPGWTGHYEYFWRWYYFDEAETWRGAAGCLHFFITSQYEVKTGFVTVEATYHAALQCDPVTVEIGFSADYTRIPHEPVFFVYVYSTIGDVETWEATAWLPAEYKKHTFTWKIWQSYNVEDGDRFRYYVYDETTQEVIIGGPNAYFDAWQRNGVGPLEHLVIGREYFAEDFRGGAFVDFMALYYYDGGLEWTGGAPHIDYTDCQHAGHICADDSYWWYLYPFYGFPGPGLGHTLEMWYCWL